MRRLWLGGAALSATHGILTPGPAEAWDRGDVHNFATIPAFTPSGPGAACPNEANSCSSDVEGVAVGPDGTVYSASYGYNNLWVAANQGDEIVVVDPSGRVVAKKGDFNGVAIDGSIQGLRFPASVEFSPDKRRLHITNLALYLPFAGVPTIAVDSGWTRQVKHNIAVIDIPPRQ
jgi:hypothetical protein